MPQIPQYQENAISSRVENADVSQGKGAIYQQLERLGSQGMQMAADMYAKERDASKKAYALKQNTAIQSQFIQDEVLLKDQYKNNPLEYSNAVTEKLNSYREQFTKDAPDAEHAEYASEIFDGWQNRQTLQASVDQLELGRNNVNADLDSAYVSVSRNASKALLSPDKLEESFIAFDKISADPLTDDAMRKKIQSMKANATEAYFEGKILKGDIYKTEKEIMNSKGVSKYLSGDKILNLQSRINTEKKRQQAVEIDSLKDNAKETTFLFAENPALLNNADFRTKAVTTSTRLRALGETKIADDMDLKLAAVNVLQKQKEGKTATELESYKSSVINNLSGQDASKQVYQKALFDKYIEGYRTLIQENLEKNPDKFASQTVNGYESKMLSVKDNASYAEFSAMKRNFLMENNVPYNKWSVLLPQHKSKIDDLSRLLDEGNTSELISTANQYKEIYGSDFDKAILESKINPKVSSVMLASKSPDAQRLLVKYYASMSKGEALNDKKLRADITYSVDEILAGSDNNVKEATLAMQNIDPQAVEKYKKKQMLTRDIMEAFVSTGKLNDIDKTTAEEIKKMTDSIFHVASDDISFVETPDEDARENTTKFMEKVSSMSDKAFMTIIGGNLATVNNDLPAIRRNSRWVTSPDGKGMILTRMVVDKINNKFEYVPVVTSKNNPILIPFDKIKEHNLKHN